MPDAIVGWMERVGGSRRLLIVLVGVATVAAIWGLSRWATTPAWVPLFAGLPIETVSSVTTALDDSGIAYRLERGGSSVVVPERVLARARVVLAQHGLPSAGRPGFELFDQPSWGMTDFTQRVNYRRALEGELERTIGRMRGVEAAQVHLALHENSLFRRSAERAAEASVVLRLRAGARPGADLVEGVAFLVASSVDGLSSENVTVLDDTGRVRSAAEPGVPIGMTRRQIGLRRELETYLESKAEELVGQVVGPENVRVRVAAQVNFDRVDRTTQSVDPDQQVTLREERAEITPGPGVQGAGSVTSATSYEVTRSLETFTAGGGTIERVTVSVLLNDRPSGREAGRSRQELARVEALVRNAIGVSDARGDAISVVSVPFNVPTAVLPVAGEDGGGIVTLIEQFQRPVIGLVAVLLAFVVATQVLRTLRRLPASRPAAPSPDTGQLAPAQDPMTALRAKSLGGAQLTGRDAVSAAVLQRPENAARMARSWLKDA